MHQSNKLNTQRGNRFIFCSFSFRSYLTHTTLPAYRAFLHLPVYLSSVKCASRSTTYSMALVMMNIGRAVREFIVHTN